MEYRRFGKSGLKVSVLSFGSWVTFSTQADVDLAADMMKAAYDAGVNFFDNAEIYAHGKSEEIMGKALKKLGWRRDSYTVSSKVMWGSVKDAKPTQQGLSRKHIIEACHQLVFTDFMGYVASDTWFVIAPDGDLYPEMAIGRFPAQNVQQLETMVSKTLIYERDTDPSWSVRALLVSDNEEYFDETSNEVDITLSDSGFAPEKMYMDERENIHEDVMTAINDGVGLVNYIGHGSVEVWGDEKILQASDAVDLRNRGRFPSFTIFTCLNGYFNHPDVDALAETLLTAPNGGVAAAIAPSSRTEQNAAAN